MRSSSISKIERWAVGLALVWWGGTARAEPDALADRLAGALTPAFEAVLRPLPPLPSAAMEDKLAFMAELGRRLDARAGHSQSKGWRTIMNWPEVGASPFAFDEAAPDTSPLRYPVVGGREDPGLDFAASVALAWLDPRRFSCDYPLRARYLAERGLAPTPLPIEVGRCRDFERWAQLDRVEAVELVYVTPSWSDPSASMGHVIFRIRRSGEEVVTGQSFEPVFAYAATDDPATTSMYLWKGLTGGLSASVVLETMGEAYRRYGIGEGRDMVLYELRLSRAELRWLLAEVWAQHRGAMAVPYAFLSVNCATLAYDLLRSVLPELPERASLLVHPHEVVSAALTAGRAVPKALLPAKVTRARLAEDKVKARWPELVAGGGREVELADALIDLETWALDERMGRYDPGATSTTLDRLLEVRATMPMATDSRFVPLEPAPMTRSGSRARGLGLGVDGGGRVLGRLALAVLDEPAGAARQAVLRRAGRVAVLKNETTVSLRDGEVHLEEDHLSVIDLASFGRAPETELGWLGSRLGFAFALESVTRPREGVELGMRLRGGALVTLAASEGFEDHLVAGALVEAAGYSHGHDLRLGGGLSLEGGLALGADGSALRFELRALPGWSFPSGFDWQLEGRVGLDLVVDPRRGWLIAPRLQWHLDGPLADRWELVVPLVF